MSFTLPAPGRTRVEVFDLLGRRVATLHDARLPAGLHRVPWDGRRDDATRIAAGVYVVRVTAGGATQHRTIVRLP